MKQHFSEADLLETYYTQPGESMPVMMHLASCSDCAARYDRLERKLREAATCTPSRPETFWTRQRMSVMRKIDTHREQSRRAFRTFRVAAAAALAFVLGGAVVYKSVEPALQQAPVVMARPSVRVAPAPATMAKASDDTTQVARDPWQSDELKDFHGVVQWESWVADSQNPNGDNSL